MKIKWHYSSVHLDIDTGEILTNKPESTHSKIKTIKHTRKHKYNDSIRIVEYTTTWRRKPTQLQIEY